MLHYLLMGLIVFLGTVAVGLAAQPWTTQTQAAPAGPAGCREDTPFRPPDIPIRT